MATSDPASASVAETSGTYYFDVFSYQPWTGGYSITTSGARSGGFRSPRLDQLVQRRQYRRPARRHREGLFRGTGESFGELADDNVSPLPSFGWNAYEKQQFMLALNEYTKITGLQYAETTNSADAEFRVITTDLNPIWRLLLSQDPAYGTQQGIGAFNVLSGGWNLPGQDSLQKGGFPSASSCTNWATPMVSPIRTTMAAGPTSCSA
jgi:hypothetical protein